LDLFYIMTTTSFSSCSKDYLDVRYNTYMNLKIYIDCLDVELKQLYNDAAKAHNDKIFDGDNSHIDCGFNLFSPEQVCCVSEKANPFNLKLVCSAKMVDSLQEYNTGFFVYSNKELSNTPLRFVDGVNVVDSGFRDNLTIMLDCKESYPFRGGNEGWYLIEKGDSFLQICAPGLVPIFVKVVDSLELLD